MSLGNYIEGCKRFELELIECLTREDLTELRKDAATLGLEGYAIWMAENEKKIVGFATATPARRVKMRDWKDLKMRRRLILSGVWYLRGAHNVLKCVDYFFLEPGDSYREVSARAGYAYADIRCRKNPLWPFDKPDPFGDDYFY